MPFKILSLDGGGSWALIQARVLQDIYGDIRGHELLRKFDMVIANSGGSLVLACLCNDMELGEIITVFKTEEKRKQIFSKLSFAEYNPLSLLRAIFKKFPIGARYNAARKREGLVSVLSEYDRRAKQESLPIVQTPLRLLPEIIGNKKLQIIIAGFDYFKERGTFFRSNPQSQTDKFNKKFYDVTLGDAIHASSNAPVNYFQEYAEVNMECRQPAPDKEKKINWFWDGAVAGFNNPVLAGLVEALTNETERPLGDFKILSIGTGSKGKAIIVDHKYSDDPVLKDRYEKNRNNPFVLSDDSIKFKLEIAKLAESILSDPPDSATFIASSILNRHLDNTAGLVRINPCITPQLDKESNQYRVPDAYKNKEKAFLEILRLEMDAVENQQVKLIEEVADLFIVNEAGATCLPNQFIRGENAAPNKLGFGTYREAKARWMEIESGDKIPGQLISMLG
jgi:patatin-like phospholipase/acyl hydrolase